jgi:hypothetical protein
MTSIQDDLESKGHYGVPADSLYCGANLVNIQCHDGMPLIKVLLFTRGLESHVYVDVLLTPAGNAMAVRADDDLVLERWADPHERIAIDVARRWQRRPARFLAVDGEPPRDLRPDAG